MTEPLSDTLLSSLEEAMIVTTSCPRCGSKGKIVPHATLQSLLLVDLYLLQADQYRFCRTPDCPVAYFADDGLQTFTVDQVCVPIWQKNQTPTTPVCYCFKVTPTTIREELHRSGVSTAIQYISNGIQNNLCACEITNPQGSCCLGNVRAAIASLEREMKESSHTLDPADGSGLSS